MDRNLRRGAIAGWLVAAFMGSACAQSAGPVAGTPDRIRIVAATAEAAPDNVLREIEDPFTGDLWLLLRDLSRTGGPGRLVLAHQQTGAPKTADHGPAQTASAGERPIIHSGDAVIVEEHTATVDARLEAIALGPAVNGAYFKARLKIGGRVLRVAAVSPGRAVFAPESGRKP